MASPKLNHDANRGLHIWARENEENPKEPVREQTKELEVVKVQPLVGPWYPKLDCLPFQTFCGVPFGFLAHQPDKPHTKDKTIIITTNITIVRIQVVLIIKYDKNNHNNNTRAFEGKQVRQ